LDKPRVYAVPERLRLNHWALSGDWTVGKQATVLNEADGQIARRFHARDLHLVMGPAAAHGMDVDRHDHGTVAEQRLYQLIRQPRPITDRQFEVEFVGSGVEVFALTFG
jgi:Thioredoxin like C-terminal domain